MDILQVLQSIDWLFALVLLVGGRYWGARYIRIFAKPDYNFLLFATIWGIVWILTQKLTGAIGKDRVGNLVLTYLFTTSFYQIIAKRAFEIIEKYVGHEKE